MVRYNIFAEKSPPGMPIVVQKDGGFEGRGTNRSIIRFNPLILRGGTAGKWFPLISIRLTPLSSTALIIPLDVSITPITNATFSWALLLNDLGSSMIQGVDKANWQSVDDSSIQYDFSRDDSNALLFSQSRALSGGTGATKGGGDNRSLKINWHLAQKLIGMTAEYILAVNPVNSNERFIGSIDLREIL